MADVTVTTPAFAHHGTTPAAGADRVDFDRDCAEVWVKHRGDTDGLWVTVGGQGADDPPVPAAGGGQSRYVAPGGTLRVAPDSGERTRVRVFCASAQPYSVEEG